MRVQVQRDGFSVVEECADVKSAFEFLAACDAVLGETKCGACGAKAIFDHRTPQGYNYYTMSCTSCGCQLSFGQLQSDGSLFAKRKNADGGWLPNKGWVKREFNKPSGDSASRSTTDMEADEVF